MSVSKEDLETLRPLYKAAVILRRHYGMSYEDIAKEIGISREQARNAFALGLAQLTRTVMAREGSAVQRALEMVKAVEVFMPETARTQVERAIAILSAQPVGCTCRYRHAPDPLCPIKEASND